MLTRIRTGLPPFFPPVSGSPPRGLLVLPLRAFHHSTNIGSGIDPINELEVGEDLPRCEPFDFLLAQAVEPIKKRALLGGQLRRLFGAKHGDWIMLSQRSVFPRCLPHLRCAPDSSSSPRKSTMSSERHWSGKRGSSIWGNNRGSELLAGVQRSGAGPR